MRAFLRACRPLLAPPTATFATAATHPTIEKILKSENLASM
jgi:hypothetical protein